MKIVGSKVTIEKDGRIVGTGRRAGQLYALDVSLRDGNTAANASAMASKRDGFELWHRRFGHLGTTNLKSLWKHEMVETTSKIEDWPSSCIC